MNESCFPKLQAKAGVLGQKPAEYWAGHQGAVELFCADCDFYREDERELECGAFKILKRLLEKKIITPEDVLRATRD